MEPADKWAMLKKFFEHLIPFNKLLGLRLESASEGRATVRVPFREELIGDASRPALHGGVLSAAIDTAGGAAAFSLVNLPSDRVSTIDLRVDYLRPAELRDVLFEARVTRMGNHVASVDIVAFHEDDPERIIATGKAAYSIKRAR